MFTQETQLHFGGNGQPVDELDSLCLQSFQNYRCFQKDMMNNNFKKYPMALGPHEKCHFGMPFEYHQGKNGALICGPESNPGYRYDRPGNICKLYSCIIERDFAEQAFRILGRTPGDFRKANTKNYSKGVNGQCRKKGNGIVSRDSCCGNYPKRFPYDPNSKVCCAGDVKEIGGC